MIDLKTYGYTDIEAIPDELLPGRVIELQRERLTVVSEYGEITAVLKGTFYHSAEARIDFPCAVLAALADGSLPLERWKQYIAHQHENKYVQGKTSYPIDKRTRNKRINMQSKQTGRNGGWKK